MKLRISFIEYLNSVPLGWGFLRGPFGKDLDVVFDVPSQCGQHLSEGQVDVGLIPTIEYQRIPDLRVLPGISIAAKREVKSVLFVTKKKLPKVSRIAVDVSSRTSVSLLRIIFEKFHGIKEVTYHPEIPQPERMLELYDAALIIGNAALEVPPGNYEVIDLAEEWNRFTGLPFVFAFWAVRSGVELGSQVDIFYKSRDQGLKEIELISSIYARKLGLKVEEVSSYIRNNLDYSLDEPNFRGLQTFFDTAAELEIIPLVKPVHFYNS